MKIKKYKRKKKKIPFYKKKVFWYSLLIFIFLSGLVYLFLFSPVFRIQKIEAFGCRFLDCKNIESDINSNLKASNLFLFNKKKFQQLITNNYLDIDDLSIKRKLPGIILVNVSERKGKAIIKGLEKYLLIDKDGFAFRKIEDLPQLPKICFEKEVFLKDSLVNNKDLNIILSFEKEIKEKTVLITDCYFLLEDRLEVSIRDKDFSLYFDKSKNVARQVTDLRLVLEEEIKEEQVKYIDLRFDKIFYK